MKVLGVFSKGIKYSVSLNIGLPYGKYCSKLCKHGKNHSCYAFKIVSMYPSVKKHLTAIENEKPAEVINWAIQEVRNRKKKITWFRFNVLSSLPHINQRGKNFDTKLIELVKLLRQKQIPVHLPVETLHKYRYYQKLLKNIVTVRLSCSSLDHWKNLNGAVNYTIGIRKQHSFDKLAMAKEIRLLRKENHPKRKIIICPAILTNKAMFPHSKGKIKCGQCQACSKPDYDVIYLLH